MADSAVSFAAARIERLIDEADLFDVLPQAKAVQKILESIEEFFDEVRKNENLDKKKEFLSTYLPKLRKLAYEAENVVDTYVSVANNSSGLGLKFYWSRHRTSKELRRLRREMEVAKKTMLTQYYYYYEEEEEEYTMVDSSDNTAVSTDDKPVVGIESDVQRLVKMLTTFGGGKGKKEGYLDVLAIVGMGGSGKTTLANNIYNHSKVKRHFQYQAWVSLPQKWIPSEIVSEISRQIHSNNYLLGIGCHHCDESEHDDYLVQTCPRMKKCLLVLDGVWDWKSLLNLLPKLIKSSDGDDHHETDLWWDYFNLLKNGYGKTKIIVTSRHYLFNPLNDDSLKLEWLVHEMQPLSAEDGRDLFNKISANRSHHGKELAQEYCCLATEMLRKCGGLPLAIVALGKLLKTKDTSQGWEKTFTRLMSMERPNDLYLPVTEILALSYHHLPYYLKPCFLYFGLFPEDFSIKAGSLIRMWIAEGFIMHKQIKFFGETSGNATLEGVARWLLHNLTDRTMVQVVDKTYSGKLKTLRIHDIIRDLCIKEAQKLDFLTVCCTSSESDDDQITSKNSRRAAINLRRCSTLPLENSHLRSLFLHEHERVGKRQDKRKKHTILNLTLVFEKFKLLRVLDINGIQSSDGVMPKDIGNLIHLRYLRIRSTNIRELPESIGKLRKLLTLDYRVVLSADNSEIRLPNALWKMRQLRHLYLPNEIKTNTMDSLSLDKIKGLQTLWDVRGGNWMVKEMPKLSTKINKLSIQGISSCEQMKSLLIKCPMITTHDCLYSLALDWYGFSFEGLEALCSKISLKKLRLMGKVSLKPLKFPSNLEKLELYYTQFDQQGSMEAIGELKCLKVLRLAKDSFVGNKWNVSTDQPFPQLEELNLSDLSKLEKWEVPIGTMPCLKKLSVVSCTSLNQIPQGLKPVVLKIEHMPVDFGNK